MSININLPDDSRVRRPVIKFNGVLFLGQFDFNIGFNIDVPIMELDKKSIYLIERVNFSAEMNEGVWLKSQDTIINYPNFRLDFKQSLASSLYPEPVRCLNYLDNSAQVLFFRSAKGNDELRITFSGKVNQVAETVGSASISAQASFTIYQMTNLKWIDWFLTPGTNQYGLVE